MAKQNNKPPAAPAAPAAADTQTEQAAAPAAADTQTEQAAAPAAADTQTEQAAAPAAAVSNVIEMDIHRIDEHPDGGQWIFGRAVNQPDASNVMANESWGGNSPRGFMEIVVTDGELIGLQAGHRVRLTVEIVAA